MRLKRSRKQPGTGLGGQNSNQESQSSMSDDDKIRLQFTLDTEEFGRAVRRRRERRLCLDDFETDFMESFGFLN